METLIFVRFVFRMKNEDIASVFSLAYCVLKCCQTVSGDLVHTFLSTPPLRKLSVNLNQEESDDFHWKKCQKWSEQQNPLFSKSTSDAKSVRRKLDKKKVLSVNDSDLIPRSWIMTCYIYHVVRSSKNVIDIVNKWLIDLWDKNPYYE